MSRTLCARVLGSHRGSTIESETSLPCPSARTRYPMPFDDVSAMRSIGEVALRRVGRLRLGAALRVALERVAPEHADVRDGRVRPRRRRPAPRSARCAGRATRRASASARSRPCTGDTRRPATCGFTYASGSRIWFTSVAVATAFGNTHWSRACARAVAVGKRRRRRRPARVIITRPVGALREASSVPMRADGAALSPRSGLRSPPPSCRHRSRG